ncbi:nucleotidyltransferase domain-containing protein [Anaerosacchariphilus polymeriproducens]|uniref:Nucleotidyltransferase n=1 Tax=Anaerosacchariphilus polymeriproducens TaxID=1812858 RepID=A0A371ATR7_9FIRM|nr:nucleotidyltransferase domain-containing protein [Anaerosacchariphilus polymeriproducens]RDU22890.1 nucleotidyltransferase [Anaerosacchariphilus polymeriproducens]
MIFKDLLKKEEYDFLKSNKHLDSKIILLGVAGSYSYGTNIETSDIDLRGIALNSKSDLIGMSSFEQYEDTKTDTTIYSFHKIIKLLQNCNPNTIELLGLNPEHYLYRNKIGEELLENKKMFLSKKAVYSFGGYASQQLRRLQNALAKDSYPQKEKEQHILNSVNNAIYDFKRRYNSFDNGSIHLYIEESTQNPEIYMDINLMHYPLRDYKNIWAEMNNIVKSYEKLGKRNKKKDDIHLNKHAMHLIRLYMMAIDILEKEEIVTYRKKEQELLLRIRNGEFQNSSGNFRDDFFELLRDYEKRLEYAKQNTNLPDEPDYKRIEEFAMSVNERIIKEK